MKKFEKTFVDFVLKNGLLKIDNPESFYFQLSNLSSTGKNLISIGNAYAETINQKFGNDFDLIIGIKDSDLSIAGATAMQLDVLFNHDVRFVEHQARTSLVTGEMPKHHDRAVVVADSTVTDDDIAQAINQLRVINLFKVLGVVKCFNLSPSTAVPIITNSDILGRLKEIQSRAVKK